MRMRGQALTVQNICTDYCGAWEELPQSSGASSVHAFWHPGEVLPELTRYHSEITVTSRTVEKVENRRVCRKCFFYDFNYIGGSNSPAFDEPGKNTILAGRQQRYVPLRRNLFYNIYLRDFCIASWVRAEPVYSGTGVRRIFLEGVRHNTVGRVQYPYVYVCIAWYCGTVCPGRWPDCNGKGQICASAVAVS